MWRRSPHEAWAPRAPRIGEPPSGWKWTSVSPPLSTSFLPGLMVAYPRIRRVTPGVSPPERAGSEHVAAPDLGVFAPITADPTAKPGFYRCRGRVGAGHARDTDQPGGRRHPELRRR